MSFIPWWVHYPNVNNEILNLDWLLKVSNCNTHKIENFINLNTIKYADPILWNITSQYEANTVVVDGQTGNAYISTKAVPAGVHLNRTEYWTQIYNYADVVDTLRSQIATNEEESNVATRSYSIGDLVFIDGLLYRVIAPMIAGDQFVENSNVEKTTIEAEITRVYSHINNIIGALSDLVTTDKTNVIAAINEVAGYCTNLATAIGNLDNLVTSDKTNMVAALNEVAGYCTNLATAIGNLDDLHTSDKSSVVNSINEIVSRLDLIAIPKIVVVSDSYGTGGTQGGTQNTDYITWASLFLGNTLINLSESGAGFANVGDQGHDFEGLLSTISPSENKLLVTDIYVLGGCNDRLESSADIKNAIDSFVQTAKTDFPNAKIHIGFIGWMRYSPDAEPLSNAMIAYKECGQYQANYVNNIEWVMHDFSLMDVDGVHPNAQGHIKLGVFLANAILSGGINCTVEKPLIDVSLTAAAGVTLNEYKIKQKLTNGSAWWGRYDQFVISSTIANIDCSGNTYYNAATMQTDAGYIRGFYGASDTFPAVVAFSDSSIYTGNVTLRLVNGGLDFNVVVCDSGGFVTGKTLSYIAIEKFRISVDAAEN